jgi:hypothetical protein
MTVETQCQAIKIPITKSLERLLIRAAIERNQTTEMLARQIICGWLLADRGVMPEPRTDREKQLRSML